MKNIKILIIEDDDDDYFLFEDQLKEIVDHVFHITWAVTYEKGLELITDPKFDICFVDFLLGNKTGLNFLIQAREKEIATPIILRTEINHENIEASNSDTFS